ncbi:galactokinase [Candidatus Koribacter versatilis Ellin345]|uniref:Galactokinase n=1 Tax=Koribacter versatilis (strain Ellin345) TaxID=204669 RepID=Q1IQZ8_KORVE|nr:galactokinase [Candidatus Koribacter versatilis]ABF40702.1 galactokinase [Candidatus Koribacter versatilis Ellin345]
MTAPSNESTSEMVQSLIARFKEHYGETPRIFRAPGRVNLIGEHTDYNEGLVMPAAIDFYTWVAASPRNDRLLRVWSQQYNEQFEIYLDEVQGPPRKHWSDYVRGMAGVLESAGYTLNGANLLIDGHVPVGAGLSSSAALELSTGLALSGVSGIEIARLDLVMLSQKAENNYAGAMCGIMDQFIAGFGHAGNAILLDCRSLEYSLLPIASDVRLVICNSMVKHDLAAGEYNHRRAECAEAVKLLRRSYPQVTALRDVTTEMLESHRSDLSDLIYRRARHVVTENDRTANAAKALRSNHLDELGRLMFASHASLRDDYEVSCRELDLLVEFASKVEGLIGARMTGGGFGGCTINLVRADAVNAFRAEIIAKYKQATGRRADVFISSAAEGAQQVKVEAEQ